MAFKRVCFHAVLIHFNISSYLRALRASRETFSTVGVEPDPPIVAIYLFGR